MQKLPYRSSELIQDESFSWRSEEIILTLNPHLRLVLTNLPDLSELDWHVQVFVNFILLMEFDVTGEDVELAINAAIDYFRRQLTALDSSLMVYQYFRR